MVRAIVIVGLAAAGIGLKGTSEASAAPVNGAIIDDLATATDQVMPIRFGSRGHHWRWGSRGYHRRRWGYGSRWRWGSRRWWRW